MTGSDPVISRADAVALLDRCALHEHVGLRIEGWSRGTVEMAFHAPRTVRDVELGTLHGGALTTALDTAACFAMISVAGEDCWTVDLQADFLRPGSAPTFTVRGTVVRAGRRLGWADAAVTADDGRLVARGRGTFAW